MRASGWRLRSEGLEGLEPFPITSVYTRAPDAANGEWFQWFQLFRKLLKTLEG